MRLIVLPWLLASIGCIGCCAQAPQAVISEETTSREPVRLAVLLVFDQMRADFLDKWEPLFGTDGFRRLQTEGAWFSECHYPYATTETGPGHASMLSGCSPDQHGIIVNNWFDRSLGDTVYCASVIGHRRIPPTVGQSDGNFGSPERMLTRTLGDSLKQEHPDAKVIGLSLKDRSAILPVGSAPTGAYWFDQSDGLFVTSSYYRDALPDWLDAFNQQRVADRWFTQEWTHSRDDVDYEREAGPDDVAGEGTGTKQGRTFPHAMTGGQAEPGKESRAALANSPFGNDLVWELAQAAIAGEELGQDEVPDLLLISFSSNDLIGHCWGPDSQEVLDVTLRSDRLIAEILGYLDQHIGEGNYAIALTADHGVCPLPEVSAARGIEAARVPRVPITTEGEQALNERFGTPENGKWIETVDEPWVYLDPSTIEAMKVAPADVETALAEWLAGHASVFATYTRSELVQGIAAEDEIGQRVRKAFHPDRAGDVAVIGKPYHLFGSGLTGTTHGSPHPYDTHVPLVAFGPGIVGGERSDAVTPQAATAILAEALGVAQPKTSEVEVPEGLFGK